MKIFLLSALCTVLLFGCGKSKDDLAMEQHLKEIQGADKRSPAEEAAHALVGIENHSTVPPVPRPGHFPRQVSNGSPTPPQPANP